MGPTQKKIYIKEPVAAGATLAEAIAGVPALLALLTGGAPVVDPAIALYMAMTANNLKAIAAHRLLPVANGDTKTVITDAIIADGGDGTTDAAEDAAVSQYAVYLGETLVDLQTTADNASVAYAGTDDTVEEMARVLVANGAPYPAVV